MRNDESKVLLSYLAPLNEYLAMPGINEICINNPGTLWIDTGSQFTEHSVPELDHNHLMHFINLLAEYNKKEITPEHPLLSATLPTGERVQVVIPPACDKDQFIVSIRKPGVAEVTISNFIDFDNESVDQNVDNIRLEAVNNKSDAIKNKHPEAILKRFYDERMYMDFLNAAVLQRKNIIVSGGTSSGKSTLLNAMLKAVNPAERIITVETEREVKLTNKNSVHLLSNSDSPGVAHISMLDLLKVSLRLRPDRILVSEIRAEEAFPYLRAINSGHPGSITTLHADSPDGCFEQISFMALQSGFNFDRASIIDYAKKVIDVIVQVKRRPSGARYIDEIYYKDAVDQKYLKQQRRLEIAS